MASLLEVLLRCIRIEVVELYVRFANVLSLADLPYSVEASLGISEAQGLDEGGVALISYVCQRMKTLQVWSSTKG